MHRVWHLHYDHRHRSQPDLQRGVSHHLLRSDLRYTDPRLRGELVRERECGLRLHVWLGDSLLRYGQIPDRRGAARHHAIHRVRMRYHRWDEPAGRNGPEVDCVTGAVRIADSNTHPNYNGDGYTELYAWLVCGCAPPDCWGPHGWRLFPGQREVLCHGRTLFRRGRQRFYAPV